MYRSYGDAGAGSRGYGTGKPAASGAPNRQSVPSSPLKPRPGLGSEFGSAYGAFDDRYHRKQSSSMSMAPDRRSVVTNVREEDVTRGSGNSGARGDVRVPKFDFSNLPKSDPPSSGMSSLPSPRTGESSQSPRQPAAASRPSPTDDAAKPKGALGSARSESPIKPTLGPAERLRRTMRAKIMEKDANPTSAMKRLNKLLRLHGPDSRGLNLTQFKACMKQVLFGDAKGAAGAGGSRMDQTMTEDIEDLFDDVDIDRTGRVSAAEVWAYLMYDTEELRELSKAVVAQLIPEGEATLADTRKQAMITAFRSCGDNLNLSSVKAYFAKLGVALSNADAKALFDFMDKDNSGFVTPDELREWLEASTGTSVMDMQAAPGDALPLYSDTAYVVDVAMSVTVEEAQGYRTKGYTRLDPSLNFGNLGSSVHLWMLKMSEADVVRRHKDNVSGPLALLRETRIIDLFVTRTRTDAHLACDGFQRLSYSANTGTWFAGTVYLWLRRNAAKMTDPFPILDLALVVGEGVPSRRGFRRVPGNLNAGTVGKPLYLWYMKASYDSDTYQVNRSRAPEDVKRGLEARLRSLLRSYAQKLSTARTDSVSVASGSSSASRKSLDFAAVFERLCGPPGVASDSRGHRQLTKRMFRTYVIDEVGLFVPKDHALYLWNRLDTNHDGLVSLKEFEDFVSMDAFELAGKVKEVLDATSAAMDGGMTLSQMFGPFQSPKQARASREPVEDYVTEDAFIAALTRMRVTLSHQERGQLLSAFGFREDGLLAVRTIAQLIDDHRARRSRVARAVAKVREVLKDVAFAGKTAKSTRDRSVVASAVNFEAAWAVLSPVRIGRASVVTKEQLQKFLVTKCGVGPTDILEDEVIDVLTAMSASAETSHQHKSATGDASPDIQLSFPQFCSFLSPEELQADEAMARLVQLVRASSGNPADIFAKMDTDRSGCVGPGELRRCVNDLVSSVNEATFVSKKDGAKTPVGAVELEFFSSNEVADLIRRFDRDGDGSLNLQEFLAFVRHHIPERAVDIPKEEDKKAEPPRVIRALFASSNRDMEATLSKRGLNSVPGDLSAGATVDAVRLWLETEADPDPQGPPPFHAVVSCCVASPQLAASAFDELMKRGYQKGISLPNGGSVWLLKASDVTTSSRVTAIRDVALTYCAATASEDHKAPNSDGLWKLAGQFVSNGTSVGIWQLGGMEHGLGTLLAPPPPPRPPAKDSPVIEVVIISAKNLIAVSGVTRLQASVFARSHALAATTDCRVGQCSDQVCTSFAPVSASSATWFDVNDEDTNIPSDLLPGALKLLTDLNKTKPPSSGDDPMFDVVVTLTGLGSEDKAPLCFATLSMLWFERSVNAGRLQWVDLFDARGLRAGQLRLWAVYHSHPSNVGIISGGVAIEATKPIETVGLRSDSKAPTKRRQIVPETSDDDDDDDVVLGAAGTVHVTLYDVSSSSGWEAGVDHLNASVSVSVAGKTVSRVIKSRDSRAQGSLHVWGGSSSATNGHLLKIPIQQSWIEKGRVLVEVTSVFSGADSEASDTSVARVSSTKCRPVGVVKFALRDIVNYDNTIAERYTLRPAQASHASKKTPMKQKCAILLGLCYEPSPTASTGTFDGILDFIRKKLDSRPGGLQQLSSFFDAVGYGGKVQLRDVDRGLKRVDCVLTPPQLKGLGRGLLKAHRVGSGLSDDDDGVSELDVRVNGETMIPIEPLLSALRPVLVHSRSASSLPEAYTSPRKIVLDSSNFHTPPLDSTFSAVVRAFRAATAGDSTFAVPIGALAARDRDGTGYVSKDDVIAVLRSMGVHVPLTEIDPILESLQVHVDPFGKLNYRHFVDQIAAYLPSELSAAELALRKRIRESAWFGDNYLDFRAPFAAADVRGHGRLTLQEFQDAVGRLGVPMSQQELSAITRRLDKNGDGMLDYYEFSKLIDLDPAELATIGSRLSAYCQHTAPGKLSSVWDHLRTMDKHHTSEVPARDFRHVVLSSGLPLSAVEVALLSRQFAHGIGTVDYNRFMKFASTGVDAPLAHVNMSSPARESKPSEFVVPATDSSASLLQRLLDALPKDQQTAVANAISGLHSTSSTAPQMSMPSLLSSTSPQRPVSSSMMRPSSAARSGPPIAAVERGGMASSRPDSQAYSVVRGVAMDDKRERYKRDGIWSCPVCYFTQTKAWRKSCAMCSSANPYADDDNEIKWQCAACAFQNPQFSDRCRMCGIAMMTPKDSIPDASFDVSRRMSMSPQRPSVAPQASPMLQTALDKSAGPVGGHRKSFSLASDITTHLNMTMPEPVSATMQGRTQRPFSSQSMRPPGDYPGYSNPMQRSYPSGPSTGYGSGVMAPLSGRAATPMFPPPSSYGVPTPLPGYLPGQPTQVFSGAPMDRWNVGSRRQAW